MTITVIYARNGWRLSSYGKGWAYLLEDTHAHTSVWFQDEDATEFANQVMDQDGWLSDNAENRFADYCEVMQPAG